jgi:hypothetical protein
VKKLHLVRFSICLKHDIDRFSTCINLSSAYEKPSKRGISYGSIPLVSALALARALQQPKQDFIFNKIDQYY